MLLALATVLGAVFAVQAMRAGRALLDARAAAGTLRAQLAAGDEAGAERSRDVLVRATRTAREQTDGTTWAWAARLPWAGRQVDAVRVVARAADSLARDALPATIELSREARAGTFRPVEGRLDPERISETAAVTERAAFATERARRQLDVVDPDRLVGPLRRPVTQLVDQIGDAASASYAASIAARLLPDMLGADSPRTYALVVQNNAEIRSTGGMPGSFSVLRAEDGRIEMGFQGSAQDLPESSRPVLPLSPAERAVYGETLGQDVRDSNLTPDFPRAAELVASKFDVVRKQRLDGVVALDPVALSFVLRGVGDVILPDGEVLTSENVVRRLLNDVYARYDDPRAQDRYFARAARSIFEAVMEGRGDPLAVLRGLARAVEERRLLVWSADDAEQGLLEDTPVSGDLESGEQERSRVGLYLNDATGAKLQYYLDQRAALSPVRCGPDGAQTFEASLLLESEVPRSHRRMSKWILGFGTYAPLGSMRMNLRVYAPAGGTIKMVALDSEVVPTTSDVHEGREVATVPLLLAPGQKALVTATIETAPRQRGDAVLDTTPGIRSQPNGVRVRSACD